MKFRCSLSLWFLLKISILKTLAKLLYNLNPRLPVRLFTFWGKRAYLGCYLRYYFEVPITLIYENLFYTFFVCRSKLDFHTPNIDD